MVTYKSNFLKLWLSDAAYASASALSTGSVLTAFLLRTGMSEGQIATYLSITQFVNLAISLLFSGASSYVSDTRKPLLWLTSISGVFTVCHIVFCFPIFHGLLTFAMILLLGCIQGTLTALRKIFIYKLPCDVMDLQYYSIYAGYQGLFIGVAGIGIGFLLTFFHARYSFMTVSGFAFATAGVLLVLSGVFLWNLHPIEKKKDDTGSASSDLPKEKWSVINDLRRLLKNKEFRYLMIPNILRGFGESLIGIFAVIAIRESILSEETASLITAGTYIGTLLSCFAYVFCVKYIGIGKTCLCGGILFALVCLSLSGGSLVCIILYAVAYIGYNMVCCAIPDLIYRSVSSDLISIFQTWRLALTQLGLVLASAIYGFMIEAYDGFWLILIGCICYLVCALCYFCYFRRSKKTINV